MKTTKHSIFGMLIIMAMTLGLSTPAFAQHMWQQDDKLMKLHEQVGAHLLFQSLDLSAEQKPQLRAKLVEIRSTLEQINQQRVKIHELIKKSMQSALVVLERGETPQTEDLALDPDKMMALRDAMHELKQKLEKQIRDMLDLLTPDQQQKLRDFHPMAMMGGGPVKDFGCSGDPGDLLDQVRFAPEPFIGSVGQRIKRHSARLESDGQQDKAKALTDFWNTVIGVRKLDEAAYRQKRDQLAQALDSNLVAEMKRICQHRGHGPGMQHGMEGQGMGPGMGHGRGGHGMGPGNMAPGDDVMEDDMGPGPGMGETGEETGFGHGWKHGQQGHRKMVQSLIVSDTFYELLGK